jgi:glycosyltransferase involved in cell wall biosynthesis
MPRYHIASVVCQMKEPNGIEAGRTHRVMVGTFIHNYRWGVQIRGDERGYIEKVKRYQSLGVDFFTLEKSPSMQEGMGERIYTSLLIGDSAVPPQSAGQLLLFTLKSMKTAVRRYPSRPIAIYAYNQDVENVWIGYLLKLFLGSPLVVIYHQILPAAFAPFRSSVKDRVRRGFHPVRAVTKSLLPAINRFAATHADTHIALSEATKKDVERYLGIKNCVVIGNGLDTVKFRPIELPKTYEAVFLGRLAHQKGIDVLLKAWSLVKQRNHDAKLILLGGGESEDVALYKKMAAELNLSESVTFAGFVEDSDLVRLMNSSKLFVFPSRKEGFAQAVSQAMGCGLCCILSDIPSLREIYGSAAVLSPVEDPEALADRICDMLGAGDKAKELGRRARELAEKFSWEETVRRELRQLQGPN